MEFLPRHNGVSGNLRGMASLSYFSVEWEGELWLMRWFEALELITMRARPAERHIGEMIERWPRFCGLGCKWKSAGAIWQPEGRFL